jgi:hypothetical protein
MGILLLELGSSYLKFTTGSALDDFFWERVQSVQTDEACMLSDT